MQRLFRASQKHRTLGGKGGQGRCPIRLKSRNSGGFDKQVNRTCKRYRDCRNALVGGIGDACESAAARISHDEAGTFFLIGFSERIDEAAFLGRLAKREMAAAFVPIGSEMRETDGPRPASKLIVDYSSLSLEEATQAASILAEALDAC